MSLFDTRGQGQIAVLMRRNKMLQTHQKTNIALFKSVLVDAYLDNNLCQLFEEFIFGSVLIKMCILELYFYS